MNRSGWASVLLLGLLWITPLFAQEESADQPQTADTGDTRETETETAKAPSPSDDSPYDYRASEEISEDLSVSFPVDI